MKSLVVIGVATAVFLGACARHEWVPDYLAPECQGFRRPLSTTFHTEMDAAASPSDSAGLRGRVIVAGTRQPLSDASLVLSTIPPRSVITDSVGQFYFAELPAGTFVLRTRRVGTHGRVDTVTVPLRSVKAVVLPLDLEVMDGPCSGFGIVEVRKPWWKFW